jgi:apolipoprotein N-acyltransferase
VDTIYQHAANHPLITIIVTFLLILLCYCILKKLLTLILISLLVLLGIAGYLFYTAPEEFPQKVKGTVTELEEKTGQLKEKGKEALRKGIADVLTDGEKQSSEQQDQ